MSKRNVIHWSYEDLNMRIETHDAMTPEAIETLARRTGREFLTVFHDVYRTDTDATTVIDCLVQGEDA